MATGRPREFDPETALDAALAVFWKRGYEGATLPELTAAMGINRPSLYAAFGNKEELFRKALRRYVEGPAGYLEDALALPTGRAAVEAVLYGAVENLTDPANPGGCLILHGALAVGAAAEDVRKELCRVRAAGLERLRLRIEAARAAGEIPANADCIALARFYTAVLHGLGVQSLGGAGRAELRAAADVALGAWPVNPGR